MASKTNSLLKNVHPHAIDVDVSGALSSVPLTARTLDLQPVTRADEYPAPRAAPLTYPGNRPETSFVSGEAGDVWPVDILLNPDTGEARFYMKTAEGVWDMDDLLEAVGATKMGERIPVVTFGSNANPSQLLAKFKDLDDPNDRTIVPTTRAKLHDATPVYVPKIGIWNYSFADLYPEEGVETQVFVNWLSPSQLEAMHQTEKAYTFCQYGTVELEGANLEIPAYLYAGKVNAYLGEDGKPVRLANVVTTGSSLRALDQRAMQQELVDLTSGHVLRRFEHIAPLDEGPLTVEALHAAIQDMRNHINPETNEPYKKQMVGNEMATFLQSQGRAGEVSLLSVIPSSNQDVTPKNLKQILALAKN